MAARDHDAGLGDDRAQLLGAQRVGCDLIRPNAEQSQQTVDD
jgi:hypothetical protein